MIFEVYRLKAEERLSNAEIARRLGVHPSNVGRVLAFDEGQGSAGECFQSS